MKTAIKVLTVADLLFMLFLSFSGSLQGWVSEVVFALSFLIPSAVGIYYARALHRQREEEIGAHIKWEYQIGMKREYVLPAICVIFPSIFVIMGVSYLSNLLMTTLGLPGGSAIENEGLGIMLLSHALVPALLEEILFRYLPMKLVAPYSKRVCIALSAIYFSLMHFNAASLLYTALAGVIFIAIDIAFDSILPSLILHAINNGVNVLMIKYCVSRESYTVFFAVLMALSVISLGYIIGRRKYFVGALRRAFAKESGESTDISYAPAILIATALLVTLSNLFIS